MMLRLRPLLPVALLTLVVSGGAADPAVCVGPGAVLDLSSPGASAIGTVNLNPGASSPGRSLTLEGGGLWLDLGPGAADQLFLASGTAAVRGVNRIRLTTGASLAPGTYPLIRAPRGDLSGFFQFDGGETLLVPAPSQIKQVGGAFYRLTLQNSSTAEEVAVTAAPARVLTILALGSSATLGLGADPGLTGGGYRSQLYQALVNEGRFTPHFIGSQTIPVPGSAPAGYDVLIGADMVRNEGHSGYTSGDLMTNLNANPGTTDNNGGFWLKPGNGLDPDYIELNIGLNDYVYNYGETTGPVDRVDAIVSTLAALRPDAMVVVSNFFYRPDAGAFSGAQFNPRIQGVIHQHALAGHHVAFADVYGAVTPHDSLALMGPDRTHPSVAGYPVMGNVFFEATLHGSAYWTGGQDGQWSTLTVGHATNFALDHALKANRQKPLDASTDVYFSANSGPLPTTLGQDLAVRGVNFTPGATGPVTIAGNHTLTLGPGGLAVQAGSGPHRLAARVVLGADQVWGNVSAQPLVVSGAISGPHALATTGSYTIREQVGVTHATTARTYAGTGAIILSGANTYSGGTTVRGGTLVVNAPRGSGTGSGPLRVDAGGLLLVSGGTLTASGGGVNRGTMRLEQGASLEVGGGATFANEGTLEIVAGGVGGEGSLVNRGVVIDSRAVRVTTVSRAGSAVTLTVEGATGRTYRLQAGSSLAGDDFTNRGPAQPGTTGTPLIFTDDPADPEQGFYRVEVGP